MALIEMVLRAQPYIPGIPGGGREQAWEHATRNDDVTLKSWADIWINQTRQNAANYDFVKNSCMSHWGACAGKPVILMGSGPSLKRNWQVLLGDEKYPGRKDLKIVTNVHNFHFCEDRNLMTSEDYYVLLDSGDITIRELTDGGARQDTEWYWNKTRDRTLIAYVGAHPDFVNRWQGPIYWFQTPFASSEVADAVKGLLDSTKTPGFNVGGNVMGACLYFARAILGCSVPIWIGMDLCFGYDQKFHAWDSEYDQKYSGLIPWTDIYGNRVYTWPSYFGFKNWFDYIATGGHGGNAQLWINATEGGIMGAYHEGNIQQIVQLDLRTALHMMNMYHIMPDLCQRCSDGNLHLLF